MLQHNWCGLNMLTDRFGMNNTPVLAWCGYYLKVMFYLNTREFKILIKWMHSVAAWQHGAGWMGKKKTRHYTLWVYDIFIYVNPLWFSCVMNSSCLTPPAAIVFADGHPSWDDIRLSLSKRKDFEYAWCSSPNKAQLQSLKKWIIKAEMNYAFNWPGLVWYKPIRCHCWCNLWLPLRQTFWTALSVWCWTGG